MGNIGMGFMWKVTQMHPCTQHVKLLDSFSEVCHQIEKQI